MSMRIVIMIALLCWCAYGKAQSTGKGSTTPQTAEAIAQNTQKYVGVYYSLGKENQLKQQKQAWQKLIESKPQAANYWLNYYVSTRLYYQQKDKNELTNTSKENLRIIAEKMDKQLATPLEKSFEKQLIRYYETKQNNYKRAKQYLVAAYKLNPKNTLLYPEMALYYEIEGKTSKRNAMCEKIKNIGSNTAIYKFSIAQLKTLPNKCVIFTNGEFDTYALWQAASKLNKSVIVISYALLKNSFYRDKVFKNTGLKYPLYAANKHKGYLTKFLAANKSKANIYVSSTLNKKYLKTVSNHLYPTGFAYQYSDTVINTTQKLYANIMEIEASDFINASQNQLLKNIMPAYIILYRQYKTSNTEVAKRVYNKAKQFAQQMGFWDEKYEQYFK